MDHARGELGLRGPVRHGKSHLAEALANKAIDEGMKVCWFTLESLTAHLERATVDNTVSKFDSIMPKTLATAAVDRLLHHAHIVLTEGSSLRLTQATTGQGVVPLAAAG
ncbi:ATP-binding protein [Streptomyces sp. NPDC058394]|uniref:ATP-binding protein n=1 Tax=Streptomyces sp. NPDC058394 TaxID=3346477 RepID=UPI0036649DDB